MTSLAQQLKQLAIPQTRALLGDDTRKASFLFELKEAASFSREYFFFIGCNGLEELCSLDETFKDFESILFSESSLSFERSIHTQEVNQQLDRNIDSFLLHLCPYLQLSSAHKALEWLIQRYRIHMNNVDSLVRCFLPYHETELFPKMLKLLDLNAHRNRKWAWLHTIQKNDVYLPRMTLVNQCRTNPAFLSIVTDLIPAFVQAFDSGDRSKADRLRVVMNFYALTLIGVLDSGALTERVLSAILPVVCRGLKSNLIDYKAASYGVVCKVLQKSTLKSSLVETLMNAVSKKLTSDLAREGLCVLLLMFQTQSIDKLTKKSFKHVSRLPALASLLATLSSSFQASRLVAAILQRLIPAAVKQVALDVISGSSSSSSYSSEDESDSPVPRLMTVICDIIGHVTMDAETVTMAARLLLENFIEHCSNDAVNQEEAIGQIKKAVRIFETRYPERLDAAVDGVMSSVERKADKVAVKQFLNLSVSSVHHRLAPNSHATLSLCLHHPNSEVRLNAINYLMDNLQTLDDKDSVKETFLARLQDENAAVVTALLKDPQKLHSVFDNKEELVTAVLTKLKNIGSSKVGLVSQLWAVLYQGKATPALEAVAVSYLFLHSQEPKALRLVANILSSPLASSSELLAPLAKVCLPKLEQVISKSEEKVTDDDLSNLNMVIVDQLTNVVCIKDSTAIIELLLSEMSTVSSMRQKCLAYLLCEVSLRVSKKKEGQDEASKLKLQFARMLKDFLFEKKLLRFSSSEDMNAEKSGKIVEVMKHMNKGRRLPAKWCTRLLKKWITSLSVPAKLKDLDFWHDVKAGSVAGVWLQAVVMVTDLLLKQASSTEGKSAAKVHLTTLEKVFGSPDLYCRWLCLLWLSEKCAHLGVTPALRDSALQLSRSYLLAMDGADCVALVQSPAPVVPCLLTLCGSEADPVRRWAAEMVTTVAKSCVGSALYKPSLDLVTHYQQEISSDASYLSVALSGLKSKSSKRKGKHSEVLSALLGVVESPSTPPFVAGALLEALSGVDTMDALEPLLPLLARLVEKDELEEEETSVVRPLLARFTPTVAAGLTPDKRPLQLFTQAMKKAGKTEGAEDSSTQALAIAQVSKVFFASLPGMDSQRVVAGCLLDVLQSTDNSAMATSIRKIFKHVSLPAELLSEELAPILQSVTSSVREVKRHRRQDGEEKSTLESPAWLRATLLLEIMQTKKKIPDGCKLVPICFQILARVLEVEDMGEAEYLKQLILGVIHNLCYKRSPDTEPIEGKHLNLEAIVQCIRTSHNPHTHQQALLVLSVAAQIAPEQLLHSMMSVFTFMGANILRQDDSYSFQVITRILETVFPALVMACSEDKAHSVVDMVTMVLRVFVDAYPHIPEHRKLMVFATLLRVVGVETYMWRLLLVFVEGVAVRAKTIVPVKSADQRAELEGKSKAIDQVHVDFLINLVLEFSPLTCLDMTKQALQYLSTLPDEISDAKPKLQPKSKFAVEGSREDGEVFSLTQHNTKQLHKFRHATILTLTQLLSNTNFIAAISDKLDETMMGAFQQVLETLLSYMGHSSKSADRYARTPQAEYWRGLLNKGNSFLDSLVSLLPQQQFLAVVFGLLDSPVAVVQRKAMELLASRLKHLRDACPKDQVSVLLKIVPKLEKFLHQLSHARTTNPEETSTNGKLALYTLLLQCRVLGTQFPVTFVQVLQEVCQVLKGGGANKEVQATAMMCAAEITSCVGAHAIAHLPRFMPSILQHLKASTPMENDMLSSCVMSLHKIVDALPHFMTPYLHDILTEVCRLTAVLDDHPPGDQKEHILRSLKHCSKSMAVLPPRTFLPVVSTCYDSLVESERQESVGSLLSILSQHIGSMSREDLNSSHHQLLAFFLTALDFRVTQRKEASKEVIDRTEVVVVDTIITMVLKLKEATFRPMLLKIFEWATSTGAHRDRVVAFYHLADSLVGKLRGIFLLFAAHIIKHAAQLLDSLHIGKQDEMYLKKDKKGRKASQLLKSLLGCLQKVCLYDSQNFINKDRFNMLMQPLLDQIDNFVGGEDAYKERISTYLVPVIADFAAATKNDSLWKTLNYQLMLKTRHADKKVRMSALLVLKEMHKKLGEDYLNLLPETIPFLSELMEDECEEVESLTQDVIGEMEKTFGEPLQNYF